MHRYLKTTDIEIKFFEALRKYYSLNTTKMKIIREIQIT